MNILLSKIINIINKILIPFLVKHEMFNLLSLLLILNLKKIKEILPKNKKKYRAIVLYKSGGIDDLISSQKKYNYNILYLSCPRIFFKYIFFTFLDNHNLHDLNYNSNKNEIINLKIKYKKFLIRFLKIFKKKYIFKVVIGFNYKYLAERELHKACGELKIPFLILLKEGVFTKLQNKYVSYIHRKTNEKSEGYKLAVYSDYIKKKLIESNISHKNKVDVIGCSRLNFSHSYKKIAPKNQIVYYAIEKYRGLPRPFVKHYGRKFFNDLKDHQLYKPRYSWEKLHLKTLKILKKFAIKNPKTLIIIKIKTGDKYNKNDYTNLPQNIQINKFGPGHSLLIDSKIVIGWNTTSIIEGIAANRFILIPYFYKKNKFFKEVELKLDLKKESYANSESDFYKKLSFLNKKYYDKDKIYNNTYSLNYHLGNIDNKAGLRLNKFIKNNLFYKN